MPAKKTTRKPVKPEARKTKASSKPALQKGKMTLKSAVKKTPATKTAITKNEKKPQPKNAAEAVRKQPELWQPSPVRRETAARESAVNEKAGKAVLPIISKKNVLMLTLAYMWRYYFMFACVLAITFSTAGLLQQYVPTSNTVVYAVYFATLFVFCLGVGVYLLYWLVQAPSLFGNYKLSLAPEQPNAVRQYGFFWFSFFWRSFIINLVLNLFTILTKVVAMMLWGIQSINSVGYMSFEAAYTGVLTPTLSAFVAFYLLLRKQNFAWGKLELRRLKA